MESVIRYYLLILSAILIYSCSENPTESIKAEKRGAFDTVYNDSLIVKLELGIDSLYVEYWDENNVFRRKLRYDPTIWWQFYDFSSHDTISSFVSIDNQNFFPNGKRAMLDGRYYTSWFTHNPKHELDIKKVWFRCEYKGEVILRTGFILFE